MVREDLVEGGAGNVGEEPENGRAASEFSESEVSKSDSPDATERGEGDDGLAAEASDAHANPVQQSQIRLIASSRLEPEPEAEEAEQPLSKDQIRSRRRRDVAGRSILLRARKSDILAVGQAEDPEIESMRPRVRGDCKDVPRPCPFVLCKYHLYLDVSPRTGSIKLNFPDLDVSEMKESCVLDVAERGGTKIEVLADILNLTRERIRQLGVSALDKLDGDLNAADFFERGGAEVDTKRRLALFSQEDVEPEERATDDEDEDDLARENPAAVERAQPEEDRRAEDGEPSSFEDDAASEESGPDSDPGVARAS